MSNGSEPKGQSIHDLLGYALFVAGGLYEGREIIELVKDVLNQRDITIARAAFTVAILVLLIVLYWIKRHFDAKESGNYEAPKARKPTPPKTPKPPKGGGRRTPKRRKRKR